MSRKTSGQPRGEEATLIVEGLTEFPPPIPGTLLDDGRYEVVEFLARGGMGMVMKARQLGLLDRMVALKMLPRVSTVVEPILAKRYEKEVRAMAKLAHCQAVPHIYGAFTDDEGYYIAMELLAGSTLEHEIKEENRLPTLREVSRMLTGLAETLDAIHTNGLVHRDVKPSNVMWRRNVYGERTPVLLDLGIVRAMDESVGLGRSFTTANGVCGTPSTMSPEQALGLKVDSRGDIYSLGVLVFYSLTGNWPIQGPTVGQTMQLHITGQPKLLSEFRPELPESLEQLILQTLEKEPDKRPQIAGDFAKAFAKVVEGIDRRAQEATVNVTAATIHGSTPHATSRPTSAQESPTPHTAAIPLSSRRGRNTPVRNTIHPKPTSWWVIAPLAFAALLFGGFVLWSISGSAPVPVQEVADSAVEAEQAAPVATPEEPPVVPAPAVVAVTPLPTPRSAMAVVSPQDSRLCTEVVLGVRRMSPDVREACQRYCAASDRTDQVRIKAIRRGYCR